MYLICAIRINIVFVIIFLFLDIALFLLAAAYWILAEGDAVKGQNVEKVSWHIILITFSLFFSISRF
jgi:hypothetical protein